MRHSPFLFQYTVYGYVHYQTTTVKSWLVSLLPAWDDCCNCCCMITGPPKHILFITIHNRKRGRIEWNIRVLGFFFLFLFFSSFSFKLLLDGAMSRFALACAKENLFAVDVFLFTTTQNVYTRNCSVVLLLHRRGGGRRRRRRRGMKE